VGTTNRTYERQQGFCSILGRKLTVIGTGAPASELQVVARFLQKALGQFQSVLDFGIAHASPIFSHDIIQRPRGGTFQRQRSPAGVLSLKSPASSINRCKVARRFAA
jgi:hypothetical protein